MIKVKVNLLKRGDILLNKKHHTAIYCGNNTIVHASINEKGTATGGKTGDQTGREITTRAYYEPTYKDGKNGWDVVLRYPDPVLADEYTTKAEQIAKDDAHGYDQIHRDGPDFDCSSLVCSVVRAVGIPTTSTYTGNMLTGFKKCGFYEVDFTETTQEPTGTPQTAPSTSNGSIYIVKKGDTLTAICKRYGVTVAQIVKANPFIKDPNKIYIGDRLTIPGAASEPKSYKGKVKTVYGSPLNIRAGKGTEFKVLGQLPNRSAVTLASVDGEWLKLADRDGYVSAKYIIFS